VSFQAQIGICYPGSAGSLLAATADSSLRFGMTIGLVLKQKTPLSDQDKGSFALEMTTVRFL